MADGFTTTIYSNLALSIPNRVAKLKNKDVPMVIAEVVIEIWRKLRVCRKFLQRGRKLDS